MTRVSIAPPDTEEDVSAEQVAAPRGKTRGPATIDRAREKKSGDPLQVDNA